MAILPVPPDPKGKKFPLLAALLNFFIPGLGYAYNAQRNLFAFLLLISYILGLGLSLLLEIEGLYAEPEVLSWPLRFIILNEIPLLLFSIAFGYDAYREALEANAKNGHEI